MDSSDTLLSVICKQKENSELTDLQGRIMELPFDERERKKHLLFAESSLIVEFIAQLMKCNPQRIVDEFLKLHSDETFFDEISPRLLLLEEGEFAGEPRLLASLLYVVVKILKPKNVVETGVANGKTTLYLLKGIHDNGFGALHSIDVPPLPSGVQPDGFQVYLSKGKEIGWLVPENLRSPWSLHLGESKKVLPSLLDELGTIDFFFHDSLHTYENMNFEFELATKHLREGGVLLADNVDQNGAYSDFVVQNSFNPFFLREFGGVQL